MKLFSVAIMDYSNVDSNYLVVGESDEEIKKEIEERYDEDGEGYYGIFVSEINEIDGYKIILVKEDQDE